MWVLPRGLITIVLALEIRQALGAEMAIVPDIAFAIILLSNLLVVLGGFRLGRAGLVTRVTEEAEVLAAPPEA